jgi:hypothetical protein
MNATSGVTVLGAAGLGRAGMVSSRRGSLVTGQRKPKERYCGYVTRKLLFSKDKGKPKERYCGYVTRKLSLLKDRHREDLSRSGLINAEQSKS